METILIIGYILWTIIITECSDFNNRQMHVYGMCSLIVPVPAFFLVYLVGIFVFGLKDDNTGLFATSVSAAYICPLLVYQIIQWFNQIIDFVKRVIKHRRLVCECERLSELAKQEEIHRHKLKLYQCMAKQMANCSTPRAKF